MQIIPKSKKLFVLGIALAVIVAVLDLYSKQLIFGILDQMAIEKGVNYAYIEVTGFFNLVKVWNRGVSFGMFSDFTYAKQGIIIINVIITVILLIWLYRNQYSYLTVAIGLIIGGALGNLIDRIQNDAVADFLDFHLFSYHWPAFNVADSAVFIGAALLLLENFFVKRDDV